MTWWVAAAVVAAAATACGSSNSSPSSSAGTTSSSSSSSSIHYKGTINVGLVSDFTGDLEVASNMQGAQAYIDSVNASGGVDGYKIVPQEYDTQSSPATAVQAFRRAIAANPTAIIGASFAATSALPTLAASGIPVVGDGFAPGWAGHKTLFPAAGDLTTHLSDIYLVVAKKFTGSTKIALIGSAIDAPSQANLIQQASRAGIQFVLKDLNLTLTPSSAQFLATAEQIKSSGAGAVVGLGVEGLAQLQVDLNQLGAKAITIATDFSPATTSENGLIFSIPWAAPFVTGNPGVAQYIAAMNKYGYGSLIDTASYAPFRWAQAALLVHALQVAGPPFSQAAVVKALSETKNFTPDGITPPVSFPEFQTIGGNCQSVMQVVDGKWKALINGPSPFVCGGPSLPDPSS
jgi:branched-chain amino acid transport system substrate-binding protein